MGVMGVNSLSKTVTRKRCGYGLNPGPTAPWSSMLTTRLPSRQRDGARTYLTGGAGESTRPRIAGVAGDARPTAVSSATSGSARARRTRETAPSRRATSTCQSSTSQLRSYDTFHSNLVQHCMQSHSGVARNVNWGPPLPCPVPLLPFPSL